MSTIADKLNYLADTKDEIKASIETMGVTVSDDTTFREYADKIADISKDADATTTDILQGKTAYVGGTKITGTTPQLALATPTLSLASSTGVVTATVTQAQDGFIPAGTTTATYSLGTKTASNLPASGATVTAAAGYYPNSVSKSVTTTTQPTPSISVSSSGLITASYTPSVGYNSSTTTKSTTKQLSTKSATTYTPTTSSQTISSGYYLTGTQTISGDSNLLAKNIVSGVSIFGVSGTAEIAYNVTTANGSSEDSTSTYIYLDIPSSYPAINDLYSLGIYGCYSSTRYDEYTAIAYEYNRARCYGVTYDTLGNYDYTTLVTKVYSRYIAISVSGFNISSPAAWDRLYFTFTYV
jgi:hypothetical protein